MLLIPASYAQEPQVITVFKYVSPEYPYLPGDERLELFIYPNPFMHAVDAGSIDSDTFGTSLIVADNSALDSDPMTGVIELVGVNPGTYGILEINSPQGTIPTNAMISTAEFPASYPHTHVTNRPDVGIERLLAPFMFESADVRDSHDEPEPPATEQDPVEADPVEPRPRQGSGGGGGRTGVVHDPDTDGTNAVRIGSISWDCAGGVILVSVEPDSDGLSVSVRTTQYGSVQMTADGVPSSNGYVTFSAPMHESEQYIGVNAVLLSGRSLATDSQSINVDSCAGQRTYGGSTVAVPPVSPRPDADGQDGDRLGVTQESGAVASPGSQDEDAEKADAEAGRPAETPRPGTAREQEAAPEPADDRCGPGTVLADGICTVIVEPSAPEEPGGGCLIATAAFGTEIAPQIQILREVRDTTLYGTASGTSFMAGFNQLYYAFSPTVADWERQSPALRETVRTAAVPMILALGIMTMAEPGSEESVTAFGLATIGAVLGMYAGLPACAVMLTARVLRGRFRNRRVAGDSEADPA